MMRILIVHDQYTDLNNGALAGEDNLVHRQICVLRNLGHEVTKFGGSGKGIKRKFFQFRSQVYGSDKNLLNFIKFYNPNLILVNNLQMKTGYNWMKICKLPIVYYVHNLRWFCANAVGWRAGKSCFDCSSGKYLNAFRHRCAGIRGMLNTLRRTYFQRPQPELTFPKRYICISEIFKDLLSKSVPRERISLLSNVPSFS